MKQIVYGLRWLAILPAAIATYLLAYALYKLLFWVSTYFSEDRDGWFATYAAPGISAGAGGYFFVFVGYYIAPSFKKHNALVLMVIVAMLMGIGTFVGVKAGHSISVIEALASVVGAIIGYFKIIKDEEPF
jgi:hypothetical protein